MSPRPAAPHARLMSTAVFALAVGLAVLGSVPRRVGDGAEYLAMALNVARLQPPSLSPGDIIRVERRFSELGPGYEGVSLRIPHLKGADGRQDLPHFWLYSLLAAPGVACAEATGWHPNVGFTLVNLLLLVAAWWVAVPRLGLWLTALVLASPIVWWTDKAHGDVFTYALLTIAWASVAARPGLAVVAMGLVGAQNPPLAVTFPVLALVAWREMPVPRARLLWPTVVGAALTAMTPAYYYWRLGVPTPLLGWTAPHRPSLADMGAFIWDPNIGLAWAFPVAVFAVVAAAAHLGRVTMRRNAPPTLLALPVCVLALLLGFSQSVNANHGATPDVNRWSLWFVPIALPWLMAWRDGSHWDRRRVWQGAIIASVVWSVWYYLPSRAERYLHATASASWLWRTIPSLTPSPVEVFAERTSGKEPPTIPAAEPTCRKVLLKGGRWPAPCAPAPVPAECRRPDRFCFANAAGGGYTFVQTAANAGLDIVDNTRVWPDDAAAQGLIAKALNGMLPCRARAGSPGIEGPALRATHDMAWHAEVPCGTSLLVYASGPGADALLTLRLPRSMTASIVDVETRKPSETALRVEQAWAMVTLRLPASSAGVLVHIR